MRKTFLQFTVFGLLGITLLGSCAKTPAPAKTFPTTPAISATINGTTWNAVSVAATKNNSGVIDITSVGVSSSSMELVIPSSAPGTYSVSGGAILYNKSATSAYGADNTGQIIVTDFTNNIINGTFTGTCKNLSGGSDEQKITSGTFTAKIK